MTLKDVSVPPFTQRLPPNREKKRYSIFSDLKNVISLREDKL